jgi:predicted deacylase
MYVRVVQFGERKKSRRWPTSTLDQRQHSGLVARVVSHYKQALWKVLDLHKHPKVRRPNSTIAAQSQRRITDNDCNRYFQRKSQIFGEDSASDAAHVVGAANLAAISRGSRTTFAGCDLIVRTEQRLRWLIFMCSTRGS